MKAQTSLTGTFVSLDIDKKLYDMNQTDPQPKRPLKNKAVSI